MVQSVFFRSESGNKLGGPLKSIEADILKLEGY
jgi:hypothetical protein